MPVDAIVILAIDQLAIDEPLDDVARQHCQCGGHHATPRWYDLTRQQWVDAASEVS